MIEPQSLHDGASCWYRNVAVVPFAFGPSASFGEAMKPIGCWAAAATRSMKLTSEAVGGAMLATGFGAGGAGAETGSSRRITPASDWLSRLRNLMASHLKM